MIPYFRSVLGAYERELPDAPGHRAPGAQAVHLEGDCQAQAQVFHPVSEGPGAQVNKQVSNLHFFLLFVDSFVQGCWSRSQRAPAPVFFNEPKPLFTSRFGSRAIFLYFANYM